MKPQPIAQTPIPNFSPSKSRLSRFSRRHKKFQTGSESLNLETIVEISEEYHTTVKSNSLSGSLRFIKSEGQSDLIIHEFQPSNSTQTPKSQEIIHKLEVIEEINVPLTPKDAISANLVSPRYHQVINLIQLPEKTILENGFLEHSTFKKTIKNKFINNESDEGNIQQSIKFKYNGKQTSCNNISPQAPEEMIQNKIKENQSLITKQQVDLSNLTLINTDLNKYKSFYMLVFWLIATILIIHGTTIFRSVFNWQEREIVIDIDVSKIEDSVPQIPQQEEKQNTKIKKQRVPSADQNQNRLVTITTTTAVQAKKQDEVVKQSILDNDDDNLSLLIEICSAIKQSSAHAFSQDINSSYLLNCNKSDGSSVRERINHALKIIFTIYIETVEYEFKYQKTPQQLPVFLDLIGIKGASLIPLYGQQLSQNNQSQKMDSFHRQKLQDKLTHILNVYSNKLEDIRQNHLSLLKTSIIKFIEHIQPIQS